MKKIQINSIYVNDGQTVITLFYDESRNSMWYIIDEINRSNGCAMINIEVSDELKEEILDHAEKVWGAGPDFYILKCFRPISSELMSFIEDCWDAIRRQERKLFPIETENDK
jgi:hypothetical protein